MNVKSSRASILSRVAIVTWILGIALVSTVGNAQLPDEASVSHDDGAELNSTYDIILTSYGDNKIGVIKEIRSLIDDIGLADAKSLTENTPAVLIARVSRAEAAKIVSQFESVGASVSRLPSKEKQAWVAPPSGLNSGGLSTPENSLRSGETISNVLKTDDVYGNNARESVINTVAPKIKTVLEKVRDNRGVELEDFETLFDWFSSVSDDRRTSAKVLLTLGYHDKKLAESLLLFRLEAQRSGERGKVARAAFIHYVINSKEPLGTMPAPEPLYFAKEYGQSMVVSLDDSLLPDKHESSLESLHKSGVFINRKRYGRDDVLPTPVFEFLHGADRYRKVNAMWMAEYAALAYHSKDVVAEQLKRWNVTPVHLKWIDDSGSGTQLFVATNERYVVVSFRGTETSLTDFTTDLKFLRVPADNNSGNVHRGFKASFDSVWDRLEAELTEHAGNRRIFVTGHSLGAALAQLAAFRMHNSGMRVSGVYVFGSPLIGDKKFTSSYDDRLASRTYLHINHDDIVSRIPPSWLGFKHAALATALRFTGPLHQMEALAGHELHDDRPPGVTVAPDGTINLDDEARDELNARMQNAKAVLRQTTDYLTAPPDGAPGIFYTAEFAGGALDDHGIHQYLFKLGCAIVDEMWEVENDNARD